MKALSYSCNSTQELEEILSGEYPEGFIPKFALIFTSVSQNIDEIKDTFTKKSISIFGVTTHGEIKDGQIKKESITFLLTDLEDNSYKIWIDDFDGDNFRDLAKEHAQKTKDYFRNSSYFVCTSNLLVNPEMVLNGFEDIVGKDLNMFGGSAGDDYRFDHQFVFSNTKVSERGLITLAFNADKVLMSGRATCGWHAVGTEKIVTKSEGNHVFTVDNVPVLDITAKFGGLENVTPDNSDLITEIASNFPLQLQRPAGDPVMRPGMVIDWDDRSFYCSGSVPQGSKVRFSLPPDFDVVEEVVKNAGWLKENEIEEPDAVVVFSCGGRLLSLGPLMETELAGVYDTWNVPLAGMFSSGELGRATGGNLEFHNLTTCCIVLKEIQ